MGLLDDEEMFAKLQATPRNQILGLLSDFIAKGYSPERTQQMQGVSKFMGAPAISETLDRLSYGEPLTTGAGGLGGTTRIRPEALEAAMAVAPMAAPAARAAGAGAMAAGRAGERFAERAVPKIMKRGGMGAEMLQGMSRGTVSPMGELAPISRRPTQVDPNVLVFREKVQNRKADLKVDTDEFDPIVVIDDSGKLSILDGHNRAAVAKDRGDSLAAVKIKQAEYDALQAQGFEDGEIAWAALQRANQSTAAGNLVSQFPGADIARGGDKAWDALIQGESAGMLGGVKKGQPLFTAAPIGGIGLGAGTQDNEMPDAVRQYMANPASGLLQDEDERKKLGGLLFR